MFSYEWRIFFRYEQKENNGDIFWRKPGIIEDVKPSEAKYGTDIS